MKKNIDVEVRMVYDGDLVPWIQDNRSTNQKYHVEIARIECVGECSRPSYLRLIDENGKEDFFVNPDVSDDDSENVVKQKVLNVLKNVLPVKFGDLQNLRFEVL